MKARAKVASRRKKGPDTSPRRGSNPTPPPAVEAAAAVSFRLEPCLASVYTAGTHKKISGIIAGLRENVGELADMFDGDDCEAAVRLLLTVVGRLRILEIEIACNIYDFGDASSPDRLVAILREPMESSIKMLAKAEG